MPGDSPRQNAEPDDGELLRRYVATRCEVAFAALVRRHLSLVYHVALRKVGGDVHLAEDVAQRVFADLAGKAATLQRHPSISGWLFTSAHYASAQRVRTERRRKNREKKAHAMNELLCEPGSAVAWERLRPLLDDLVLELSERDRAAVLLRYFEGRPFAEVGARLRLSDHGARARVDRAVGKLQAMLARRGVTSTSAALGLALAQQATAALPAGVTASVTSAALASSAAAGTLALGTVGFMSIAKLTAMGATVVAIAAIGFGVAQYLRSTQEVTALRGERAALAVQLTRAEQRVKQLEESAPPAQTEIPRATPRVMLQTMPADPARPTFAFEATKKVLASISVSVGQLNLESGHIANTRAWVEQDPSGLIRWIATLPAGRQREHTTEAVIAIATEPNPEFAFLLTGGIERELPRGNRRFEVIQSWAPRDPAAAARAVAEADLPDRYRERLLSAISKFGRKR